MEEKPGPGRDPEALHYGYAPSWNRTKSWPQRPRWTDGSSATRTDPSRLPRRRSAEPTADLRTARALTTGPRRRHRDVRWQPHRALRRGAGLTSFSMDGGTRRLVNQPESLDVLRGRRFRGVPRFRGEPRQRSCTRWSTCFGSSPMRSRARSRVPAGYRRRRNRSAWAA